VEEAAYSASRDNHGKGKAAKSSAAERKYDFLFHFETRLTGEKNKPVAK
jgi:hypothetical protein